MFNFFHKCDFRQVVEHHSIDQKSHSYWMKCVDPKCNKVRDSYLVDYGTFKIEIWKPLKD